jgi:hypothetical protein
VWSDGRIHGAGETYDVYAARVSAAGQLLDPSAFPVATGPGAESDPIAIFNGESTVVAWLDVPPIDYTGEAEPTWLRAARVSPDGVVLDAPALTLSEGGYLGAALGAGGSVRFLRGEGVFGKTIHVSQNGAISGPTPLPGLPYDVHAPALVFDGTQHLFVGTTDDLDPYDDYINDTSIVGVRIGPDDILDPGPLAIAKTGGSTIVDVAAAFGAGVSVVAWVEDEPGFARLRAVRVSPDGTTLDPQNGLLLAEHATGDMVCEKPYELTANSPAVVFDGQVFVVAWQVPQDHCDMNSFDLHGATVTPQGEVGPAFVISEAPYAEGPPSLASAGDGQTLITYSRFMAEAPYGTHRVRHVRLTTCDPAVCLGGNCNACPDDPADPPPPVDPIDPPEPRAPDGPYTFTFCGCRVAGAPTPLAWPVLAMLGGVLTARRLRRRRAAVR